MIAQEFWNRLRDIATKLMGARHRLDQGARSLRNTLGKGALSDQARQAALGDYARLIGCAALLGTDQVVLVMQEFDAKFIDSAVGDVPRLRRALNVLESKRPVSGPILEAAVRLCRLLGDASAGRRFLQQRCVLMAREGDSNGLLTRVFERQREGALSRDELQAILQVFLDRQSFENNAGWARLFAGMPEGLLPPLHQVHSALSRHRIAAELAEAAGDWPSAVRYWMAVPGTVAALRALSLIDRVADATVLPQAHLKVAECLWGERKFGEALQHFEEAGQMERASDCERRLGQIAAAIQKRPAIQLEWLVEIRGELEDEARAHLAAKDFLAAAQLLYGVSRALRTRKGGPMEQAEAERIEHLLSEAVRTARVGLEGEVRSTRAQPGAEVFKRWCLLEESAGNFLEAGLQAEMAKDYFAASLLFEKAGAFGQALSALEQSAQGAEPKRRAELLERGGDFFMAGLLYERLSDTDKAVAMFELAEDFTRAGDLRRKQVGDEKAVFDEQWLELLTKAGRVDALAELCFAQTRTPGRSDDDRAKFFRRIKHLAEIGLIGPKWADVVATELPRAEEAGKADFDKRVGKWTAEATRTISATYLDCFGMDLGTSNSVVALFNKKSGKVEVAEWRGRQIIPSVFAVDQTGRELVGIPESELISKSPRAIVTGAKRMMGTDTRFKADGQFFRAEEVAARIINHGRAVAVEHVRGKIAEHVSALASKALGTTPPEDWISAHLDGSMPTISLNNAVITVPAYFNEAQKQATRTAATLANVNVLRLIHEPTAACLAQRLSDTKDETVLVVDLGAGTLDLSLVGTGGGVVEVSEIEGDNQLGSSDLDLLLNAHFVEVVKKEVGSDAASHGLAGRRIRLACEELKIELSSHQAWTISLPYLVESKTIELSLKRDELERLAAPWLQRIRDTCRRIKGRPDRVLLVGGGALMPAVLRCVKEVFHMDPSPGLDPVSAVARGAAIQAAILGGEMKELLVMDVVPFSLGIKSQVSPGEFKFDPLIGKHSSIPAKANGNYTTVQDSQSIVKIEVFQGEDSNPEKNFKIGQFRLEGIFPAKAGVPKIEVSFEIDGNCLLSVTARDLGSHREQKITIADTHLLSQGQVASLKERFCESQKNQNGIEQLEDLCTELSAFLREITAEEAMKLQRRFRELLELYEVHMGRYATTPSDNEALLEVYRTRTDLESETQLAVDRWTTLKKSGETWLTHRSGLDLKTTKADALARQINEGRTVLVRIREGAQSIRNSTAKYRRWVLVLEGLSVQPDGNAEDLAGHYLRLGRHSEALAHFRRLIPIKSRSQVELGLEIIARQRQRADYTALLNEHSELLGVIRPDFVRLNQSVKAFSSSVVWVQQKGSTGSGFAIGPNEVATNRHVITHESTGKVVSPEELLIVAKNGPPRRVASIHVPATGRDDVAILRLEEGAQLRPLNLGFSELVEVGERIMTLGFPAPEAGGFEENLYCNAGLVNRIRPSDLCSERVLEVSIELQGGISGAPILNELGEVVGLVTFALMRPQPGHGGQVHFDRSFYAIPVEVLRRLRTETTRSS